MHNKVSVQTVQIPSFFNKQLYISQTALKSAIESTTMHARGAVDIEHTCAVPCFHGTLDNCGEWDEEEKSC